MQVLEPQGNPVLRYCPSENLIAQLCYATSLVCCAWQFGVTGWRYSQILVLAIVVWWRQWQSSLAAELDMDTARIYQLSSRLRNAAPASVGFLHVLFHHAVAWG